MTNQNESTYRVYYSEDEAASLPPGVTIVRQFPAFGIISTTPEIANELRTRFPVEEISPPSPLPEISEKAGIKQALTEQKPRGPYTMVLRFELPPEEGWPAQIAAAGCQVLEPLGRSTVVVYCPNKTSLAKLEKLPNIARISSYRPDIKLSDDSLGVRDSIERQEVDELALSLGTDQSFTETLHDEPLPGAFVATFFTAELAQLAKRSLIRGGIRRIVDAGETGLVINLLDSDDPQRDLQIIGKRPGLRSLRNQYQMRINNDIARDIIAAGVVGDIPANLGLTGRGEIVAVADTGLDNGQLMTDHPDFRGRVKHIESFPIRKSRRKFFVNPSANDGSADDVSGHGTHVAGSIIGSGAAALTFGKPPIQGTAPEAELIFQSVQQYILWKRKYIGTYTLAKSNGSVRCFGLDGLPDDLTDLFESAFKKGARIHNNSWSGGEAGDYNDRCEQLDRFVWEHPDFLILVAAGNDAADRNPKDGRIDEGSIKPPGTAKNCLTVGASENLRPTHTRTWGQTSSFRYSQNPIRSDRRSNSIDHIAAFSNRGPCEVDRRKPDLVAPGTAIMSARSQALPMDDKIKDTIDQYYVFKSGTSMATPLVAGSAALVRQFLREKLNMLQPSAAMIKAILIHSAQYMDYPFANPNSSAWADNEQGWGRVSLHHVLKPKSPIAVHFIDHNNGLPVNHEKQYNYQIDDPSQPLRITLVYTDYPGKKLINNLNLVVFPPGGGFFLGNDFNHTGKMDNNNNVEGIHIEQPPVGIWTVKVKFSGSVSTSARPQDFALVASAAALTRI